MNKKGFSMRFPGGLPKAITLSYDDGVEEDIRLIELMKQYGFKGTFNLSYNRIGTITKKHRKLTAEEIRKVYTPDCTEVACHSFNHSPLGLLKPSQMMEEVLEDRKNWECFLGKSVRGMAYAYGSFNAETVDVLRLAGIAYCRTTVRTGKFDLPTDWLRMDTTCHHRHPQLMEFADEFLALNVKKEPKWFYLWGHTYEFADDDNWDLIEAFFQKMARLPDVWYATNIEIYNYVKAYEQLIFSANGKMIYNPTATDVWISILNADTICIPAGKTVEI